MNDDSLALVAGGWGAGRGGSAGTKRQEKKKDVMCALRQLYRRLM